MPRVSLKLGTTTDPMADLLAALDRFEQAQGLADGRAHYRKANIVKAIHAEWRLNSSPSDEARLYEPAFLNYRYRGVEIDMIKGRMAPNERICRILPAEVVTDQQTISRASLRNAKLYGFPTDGEIRELQERFEADQRQAEQRGRDAQRSANEAAIAAQQRDAAHQRALEQYQDAIAAVVAASNARREAANGQ